MRAGQSPSYLTVPNANRESDEALINDSCIKIGDDSGDAG